MRHKHNSKRSRKRRQRSSPVLLLSSSSSSITTANNSRFLRMLADDGVCVDADIAEMNALEHKLGLHTRDGEKRLKKELEMDGFGELQGFLDGFERKYGPVKAVMAEAAVDNDDDDHHHHHTAATNANTTTDLPSSSSPALYVPPHLRHAQSSSTTTSSSSTSHTVLASDMKQKDLYGGQAGVNVTIKRRVRAIVNKLAQSNMTSSIEDIHRMYDDNDTSIMDELVVSGIVTSIQSESTILESHVLICVAFMCIIHKCIGQRVSAVFIERIVCKWHELYQQLYESIDHRVPLGFALKSHTNRTQQKHMTMALNLLLVISHAYNMSMIHERLIHDIIQHICTHHSRLSEMDVEMILMCVKHCGYQLRHDDARGLKHMLQCIQSAVDGQTSTSTTVAARVQYMLDEIQNLRNNRGAYSQQSTALLPIKGIVRSITAKYQQYDHHHHHSERLCVPLSVLIRADKTGGWWMQSSSSTTTAAAAAADNNTTTSELLVLARQHRMNTDFRRSVFCIVMGSSDYMEAYERIDKLRVHGSQDREVARVIMYCCGQEQVYNPYYGLLCNRLCEYARSYKFTFQLAFWDIFKQFNTTETTATATANSGDGRVNQWSIRQLRNMACLCAAMINGGQMSVGCMKIVDLASLTQKGSLFFHIVFESVFTHATDTERKHVQSLFGRLAIKSEYRELRSSLCVYLQRAFLPVIIKRLKSKASNRRHDKRWWRTLVDDAVTIMRKSIEDVM